MSRILTPHSPIGFKLLLAVFVMLAGSLTPSARGQEMVLPTQPAPPPIRYVPDAERAQLATAGDAKGRVRATLALLEDRLARAERSTTAGRFDPAAADLGVYQGLIDDVLLFLRPVGRSPDGARVDGKTRDLYKSIEITLNKHTSRLEAIRRATPQDYQGNVRAALLYARDKRTECLDAFFGANVLREPPAESKPQGAPPGEFQGSTREPRPAPKKDSVKPPAPFVKDKL